MRNNDNNDNLWSLTLTQQDIYFDQLHHGDCPLYNVGGYIDFDQIDVPRIQAAHQILVRHQDAFGLRIVNRAQQLQQYISEQRTVELPIIDMSQHHEPILEAKMWLKDKFATSFDIDNHELFAAYLIKITESKYFYVGLAHHLIMDGWGFSNWAEKLGQYYTNPTHDSLATSWTDVIQSDSKYLSSQRYIKDEHYWKAQLQNLPEPLFAPRYTQYRTTNGSSPSRRTEFNIDSQQQHRLYHSAKSAGVSVSSLYLAIIAVYFSRVYTSKTIAFGIPAHNRRDHKEKSMIGVFTSVSPLLFEVDDSLTLSELARQIGSQQKRNYRHQRFPIGRMYQQGDGRANSNKLYSIGFNHLILDSKLSLDGHNAELKYLSHYFEQTPLMVTMWEYGKQQGVQCQLDHNLSYFSEADCETLAQSLSHLICQASESTEVLVGQMALLPPTQQTRLSQFNQGEPLSCESDVLIHQLFERQVKQTPAFEVLHYCQQNNHQYLDNDYINKRSNQLARYLQSQGIIAGERIGITLSRTPNIIIAILSVLKVGAAYVPLDPSYPDERLQTIATDSAISMILSESSLVSNNSAAPILNIDTPQIFAHLCDKNLDLQIAPNQAAYVIYTSGSTGRPKGVIVSHANVINLLSWAQSTFEDSALARVLASTSINFDISVFELFVPLCLGYQCVLVEDGLSLLDEQVEVTLINTVPSVIKNLLQHKAIPVGVNTINLAGEPLTASTVNQLLSGGYCSKVINLYGPTENTVYSTWSEFIEPLDSMPDIGRPIANISVHVLSEQLEVLPVGAVGELFLGGDGVSFGYLNQPQLTAKAFIESPFGAGKLYRTGDFVRFRHDGKLEFLGRKDGQIKLRGLRIELGEVEYQLARVTGVKEVQVSVIENQLVAYVVAESIDNSILRQQAGAYLPRYMLPDTIVRLDEFPQTANGKIDKKALPIPSQLINHQQYIAPSNHFEKRLVEIWAKLLVLPEETLSCDSNFFELGGQSLLVVNLTSEIRKHCAIEVSVKDVFEAPTIIGLAAVLQDSMATIVRPDIKVIEGTRDKLPMSFAQQRLWFIDQLNGGSTQYNMTAAFEVKGAFNPDIAEQAINHIIKRHESLRTVFKQHNGLAQQHIIQDREFKLNRIDLSDLTSSSQKARWQAYIDDDQQQQFDLSHDILMRVSWLSLNVQTQTQTQHGILLFNMHHIISDGYSMGILAQEFSIIYQCLSEHKPLALTPLQIQYADYAMWQRDWLKGKTYQQQLSYWTKQLADAPLTHSVPLDKPRPLVKQNKGKAIISNLPLSLAKKVESAALNNGVTPFMLMHGALALMLSRHANQNDILIGTPVANRLQSQLSGLIGCFVNSLVLRTDVRHDTVSSLLNHIKEVNLSAQVNQDVPFEQLVEHCQIERDLQLTPLFQIMFSMNNTGQTPLLLPDSTFTPVKFEQTSCKFDLQLEAQMNERGIELQWIYDTSIFNQARIECFNQHFSRLLDAMTLSDDQRLEQLPMLSPSQINHLVMDLNNNQKPLPQQRLLHGLFEQQVKHKGQNIALIFADQQITYQALNEQANRIAHHLNKSGIKAGKLIGLCVNRGVEMAAGLIAILKSGCAYVPLDPAYPEARLNYMVQNSEVEVVLTLSTINTNIQCKQKIWLDEPQQFAHYPSNNLNLQHRANQLAYVIYTSGSTGLPKGVAISHDNATAMLFWADNQYIEAQKERVLASTSLNFDLSIFELFLPWCFGHQCVLVKDALELLERPIDVTLINTVPSVAKVLLAQGALATGDKAVKVVNLAGEPLTATVVNELLKGQYCEAVYNLYGPSEDTTYSTYAKFTQPINDNPDIGKAITNTQAYLLSNQTLLVPKGTIGELYLGGAGVAQGYINNPQLTQQRFIDNPFGEGKLYRTGDLAYHLDDGRIVYVGRIDDQVKIRGFRIELGEIEHVLLEYPEVSESLVMAHKDNDNQPYLVAYIIAQGQSADQDNPWLTELKSQLSQALPAYMIPSDILVLEQWPLTANGKIDKLALPIPQRLNDQPIIQTPEDKTQLILASLWAKLLKLPSDKLSVNANFFELGGHSLLIAQMIHQARLHYGIELKVGDIFHAPTIATLANLIDNNDTPEIYKITKSDHKRLHKLSASQYRIWFVQNIKGPSSELNVPLALKLSGNVDRHILEQSLNYLIERHDMLRCSVVSSDGSSVQQVAKHHSLAVEFVDLSTLSYLDQQKDALRLGHSHDLKTFDIAKTGLMSALLLKFDESQWLLRLNFHHIICDGWSLVVFVNELVKVYASLATAKPVQLNELPFSYLDYSQWQSELLASEQIKIQEQFWNNYLDGCNEQIKLPFQVLSAQNNTYSENTVSALIDPQTTDLLVKLAQNHHGSLFNVVHTALVVLIARLSGENDINIGTSVSGRHVAGSENLFGALINNLPIRSQLDIEQTFSDCLNRQIDNAAQVLSNQDLPFERILALCGSNRSNDSTPLFQIFLNVLNLPQVEMNNDYFDIELDQMADVGSKFNLTFYVRQTEQGCVINCNYNAQRFNRVDVDIMLSQYISLLEQIVLAPDRGCFEYSLRLDGRGSPAIDQSLALPWQGGVHQCFEAIVQQWPLKQAITFNGKVLLYSELNQLCDQYASELHRLGVQSSDVVGIMARRNDALVIATMAVLKVGAAFMMLSNKVPTLRILQQLEEVTPQALITLDDDSDVDEQLKAFLTEKDCRFVTVKADYPKTESANHLNEASTTFSSVKVAPDAVACIGFTSGTSGRPKAVMGRHSSLTIFMPFMQREFGLNPQDRFGMMSGLVHDPLQRDIFTPLCIGATLYIPNEIDFEVSKVNPWLKKNKISVLHLTPSLGTMLCSSLETQVTSLRLAFFVGEALTCAHVRKFKQVAPNMAVINLYGSTETARAVSYYRVKEDLDPQADANSVIAVGQGIEGVQLVLLNAKQTLCGVGELGQIGIRSEHLSLGYGNDRELTDKQFIVNSSTQKEQDLIYLTGDIGFYRTDGNVECLGRLDKQIKIRGFRVELAEIEVQLQSYSGVHKTAVITNTTAKGDLYIVAFVVMNQDVVSVTEKQLRDYLAKRLPDYLIPSHIVKTDNIPLTENGKLDSKQLKSLLGEIAEREIVKASSATEKTLLRIWQELLEPQDLSVLDDFFVVGGHSILATQLLTRIQQTFGVELNYRQLFEDSSIRTLSARIDQTKTTSKVIKSGNKKRKLVL